MEPIATLKRQRSIDFNACIVCQIRKPVSYRLITGGNLGHRRLNECALSRLKLLDCRFREAIGRILSHEVRTQDKLYWHRGCYSQFIAPSGIARLKKNYCSCNRH